MAGVPRGRVTQNLVRVNAQIQAEHVSAPTPAPPVVKIYNDIGKPDGPGFGVGVCPPEKLPTGFSPLFGNEDPLAENYGNYQYNGGAVCYVPACWIRIGSPNSPRYPAYGKNAIDILPADYFPGDAEANAQDYYWHRAFINAGQKLIGRFRTKYLLSWDAGETRSLKNGKPVVPNPVSGDQYGFAACTANGQTPPDNLGGAIEAAKSIGPGWHCEPDYFADVLQKISLCRSQSVTSNEFCAWYDGSGVMNFPKGNNDTLKDVNDSSVTFDSAEVTGFAYLAKTGSGAPFAKTTHNGEVSGIADVNGNYWQVLIGTTCRAVVSRNIEDVILDNPVKVKVTGHGLSTDAFVQISGITGTTQLNKRIYRATRIDDDHVSLNGVDGAGLTAYVSGGAVVSGVFYRLKESSDINILTSETSGLNGHWSAAALAALFEPFEPDFRTDYPHNGFAQRLGNGAEAVYGWSNPSERSLSMIGIPLSTGVSESGTNAFGVDYNFQYICAMLCVISRGDGSYGSNTGVGCRYWNRYRTNRTPYYSFAASFCVA